MGFLNRLASEGELRRNKSIIMKTFHGYSIFNEILELPTEMFKDNFFVVACSNEAIRRCKTNGIDAIPLSVFVAFYDEDTDTVNKNNMADCSNDNECPSITAYQRMYTNYEVDKFNSNKICIILDPELGNKKDIHNLCRFRNRIYNSGGHKLETTTIYVLNNVYSSLQFYDLELPGLIKWMAVKSERDILDVRLEVSNNKLPGFNMELIYLANGIRKNTIPLDIPKQARSYSLEVIGCSDDLKRKVDYERITSDGSTIVTNDLPLMAYLNDSIRRSIYGNEVHKLHIGDRIISHRNVYGENFIIPKGTVLMVSDIVKSEDEFIDAVLTSEFIINDILDDEPKSAQVRVDRWFLDNTCDSTMVSKLGSAVNDTANELFSYAYAVQIGLASINSYNSVTAIFDRHDPIMCEASIMLCRKYYRYIHIPLYYDVFDE